MSNADVNKLINNSSILVGTKQVLRACANDVLRCVILASDADHTLSDRITALCSQHKIDVHRCASKKELGTAVKIDVACAVIGVLKT